MSASLRLHVSLAASVLAAAALPGCSVHYSKLSGVQQAPQYRVWQGPAVGNFLCLTSTPGTPIYAGDHATGPIIRYTRSVVAFQGQQNGGWISVVFYDDPRIGWIDGTIIKPFQPAHPGQRCIVTVDTAQRPIFQIY